MKFRKNSFIKTSFVTFAVVSKHGIVNNIYIYKWGIKFIGKFIGFGNLSTKFSSIGLQSHIEVQNG